GLTGCGTPCIRSSTTTIDDERSRSPGRGAEARGFQRSEIARAPARDYHSAADEQSSLGDRPSYFFSSFSSFSPFLSLAPFSSSWSICLEMSEPSAATLIS